MAEGERSSVLDRSAPELIRRLIDDADGLIQLQIRLAKQEARENLTSVAGGAKWLGIAAGLGLLALISLVVFLITGLAALFELLGVPVLRESWFWALVLTALFGIVAFLLVKRGIGKAKISPLARTRETLREDIEWVRQPMRPSGK